MNGFFTDLIRAIRRAFREFPTKSELERVGVIGMSGGSVTPPPAPARVVPPSPTGVTFAATITNILVDFEQAAYTGHAYSELLRADTDSYGDAVAVSRINGAVGAYPTGPDKQGYFWVRHVSQSATAGPPNNQAGTLLKTGQDPTDLFNALSAAARAGAGPYSELAVRADDFSVVSPTTDQPVFTVVTTPYTNNGVNVPVGVYFADGFILRGSIVNATIANAAIDNAKIANVSAAKITAGSIAIGEYIGSSNYVTGTQGWRIDGAGNAEFSGATVRGQIVASSGSIGGISIASDNIQSSNFITGSTGFRLLSNGSAEFSGGTFRGQVNASSGDIGGVLIGAGSIRAGQTAFNTGTGFFLGSDGKLSAGSPTGPGIEFDGDSVAIRSGPKSNVYHNNGAGVWTYGEFHDFELRHNGDFFVKRGVISGGNKVYSASKSVSYSVTNASMAVNTPYLLGRFIELGVIESFPGDATPGVEEILDGYFCRAVPIWTLSGAAALTWGLGGNVTVHVVPTISWQKAIYPNRETQQSVGFSALIVNVFFEVWVTATKVDDPFTVSVSSVDWALFRG